MSRVAVTASRCDNCGHVWLPRSKPLAREFEPGAMYNLAPEKPKRCPQCKSRRWDRQLRDPLVKE